MQKTLFQMIKWEPPRIKLKTVRALVWGTSKFWYFTPAAYVLMIGFICKFLCSSKYKRARISTTKRNKILKLWYGTKYSRMDQVKFLKAVFHKFHLVHSWIPCPIWHNHKFWWSSQSLSQKTSPFLSRVNWEKLIFYTLLLLAISDRSCLPLSE